MKARANAIFISNIYNQEVVDTNWNEYQTIITANNVNALTIRTSETTANNLSVTSNYSSLVSGSKIYVSNNGTTLIGGTIGGVSIGSVRSNTSNKIVDASRCAPNGNTIYTVTSPAHSNPMFMKPDGTMLWMCDSNGVIREWRLTVPGNPASGVSTGKSVTPVGTNLVKVAFCFSYDGKYLYRCGQIGGNNRVVRNSLSTAWDISTISPFYSHNGINMYNATLSDNRNMRISKDGKTIIIFGPQQSTNIYKSVLSNAWDLTSYVSGTTSTITGASSEYANFEVSEDGKTWWAWSYASGTVINLVQGIFGTVWDPATMSISKTIPLTGFSTYGTASNIYPPVGFITPDGKTTWIWFQSGGGIATYNLETQGGDAAMSYNIDISGFNLTSAPNTAWLSMANVYVALTRTANNLYSYPYQIDLDTDTPATTTQAVVGIDGTGVLVAGDTVLLNGTTSVTLTSVTETANGLNWKDPSGTTDYIRYYGKNYQTGLSTTSADNSVSAHMNIKFSNNGQYFYIIGDNQASSLNVVPYGIGLYQYIMSTPWDVSTASFLNFLPLLYANAPNGTVSGYQFVSGFDMNPDGTKFFVITATSYATGRIHQFNLSQPHDLNSISSIDGPYVVYGYSTGTAGYRLNNARFNRTGTQLHITETSSGGALYNTLYTLNTPWDITSTTWGAQTFYGPSSPPSPSVDMCFTPTGENILCLGQGFGDSYLTMQPANGGANNSWTNITWNTKSSASSNIADYPVGSIIASTTGARGMDISPDGTKLYIIIKSGQIFQFATRLKALNKYVITYPTQASAPTSIFLPDSSVLQTLTPSLDVANNTIVYTGTNVSANGRAVQFKLTGAPVDTEVTQVRINLKKSQ